MSLSKIILVFFILSLISLLGVISQSKYHCTENGCKLTPFGGKYSNYSDCKKNCTQEKSKTDIPKNNSEENNKLQNDNNTLALSMNKNNIKTASEVVNEYNENSIQQEINRKKHSSPYFATIKQAQQVITDYDVFPYPRYFRGQYNASFPIIAEREAGWRPRNPLEYTKNVKLNLTPPCVPTYGEDIFFKNL